MGCDIHMHIEVKVKDVWIHYAAPTVDRWYDLFGVIAGVRNEHMPLIVEPKGLPDDLSFITELAHQREEDDAHTESWLNLEEIGKLRKWIQEQNRAIPTKYISLESSVLHTYLFNNHFAYFGKPYSKDSYPTEVTDVRFVFWFDN